MEAEVREVGDGSSGGFPSVSSLHLAAVLPRQSQAPKIRLDLIAKTRPNLFISGN